MNHRETVPLHELVREVGISLGLDDCNDVNWHNKVPEQILVEADHDRLFRVFLNLGKNADKALKEGGQGSGGNITIEASQDDQHTVITVSDDGPGLPDIALKHLFQAFVGSASKGGSGLGLTTARDLMRAHGGELTLASSSADGTCFEMVLPR